MRDVDRRKFLSAAASLTASLAAQAQADEQGDIAASRPAQPNDPVAGRDPLGLRGTKSITPEAVRRAIEQGAHYLKSTQRPNGAWPEERHYDGGLTPLCTLALLHSGCEVGDEAIAGALNHIRGISPRSTYTTSIQT